MAPGVEIQDGGAGRGFIAYEPRSGRYLRLAPAAAAVLGRLDGSRTIADICAELGRPDLSDQITTLVTRLTELELIASPQATVAESDPQAGRQRHRRRERPGRARVRVVPPFVLQIDIAEPGAILVPFVALVRAVSSWPGRIVFAALVVAGGISMATALPDVQGLARRPVSLSTILFTGVILFAVTVLHELMHAAVLRHFGGRPRRIGVMIFYGAPAMFCDVSDAWRLPERRHRAAVAAAGPLVQLACGSLLATLVPFTAGAIRDALLLAALAGLAIGVVNACPLLKLDGYVAIASYLDRSHLRRQAITSAREWCRWLAVGGRRPPADPGLTVYGAAAALLPPMVIGWTLLGYRYSLEPLGRLGALLRLALLLLVIVIVVQALGRYRVSIRDASPSRWRMALAVVALLATSAALGSRPTSDQVAAVFLVRDGQVLLVIPEADRTALRPGAVAVLHRNGILNRAAVGRVLLDSRSYPGSVPVDLGLVVRAPVRAEHNVHLAATLGSAPNVAEGTAIVTVDRVPLAQWLLQNFAVDPWRDLF
jgi:putative peptide zinc metalloprotease protein